MNEKPVEGTNRSKGSGAGAQGPLKGRAAIVTGATAGIGKETCLALARAGANVVAVGRNLERLVRLTDELNEVDEDIRHLGLALDVRSPADMEEMARRSVDEFGGIDILVTAAGILRAKGGRLRTLRQMTTVEWDEVIDTNLKGVFLSNRAVMAQMTASGSGNIINLSSTSGRKGLAFDSAYCASKFGVVGFSEALADEARQSGVRVQTLLPGAIETGMWGQNGPLPKPGNVLSAECVADVILYMITMPEDTVITDPLIEPFKTLAGSGWIGGGTRPAGAV